MMRRTYWFLVLILLLSLPALACGLFGGDDAEATAVPEATPVVEEAVAEATAVPQTEDTSSEEPVAEETIPALPESALTLDAIGELPFNSYHITMVLEITGKNANGEEVVQTMNSNIAISSDPQIMSMVMNFSGIDDLAGSEKIEMTQVEGTSYMVIPEMGCVTTSGGDLLDENPFTSMMQPSQFLNDLNNAKYEGEETINGIPTHHYSFDERAMNRSELEDIDEAEGHIYIAQDGDFLVRMVFDATGKVDLFDQGTEDGQMHIELNLIDVDVPIEAAIPEACAAEDGSVGGVNSEFPLIEDASEVTSFAGVLSYQTALPVEDILAFYDDALAAEGWVKDEASSFVADGSGLISYTRDDVTLSVTVSPNETGSGNYVILLSDTVE